MKALVCVFALGLLPATQGGETQAEHIAIERDLLSLAARNVETVRKSAVRLEIQDDGGRACAGATVEILLRRHAFKFGSQASPLVDNAEVRANPGPFQRPFTRTFNFAVLPFFWRLYEPEPGVTIADRYAEPIAWARANGIALKGHPLAWAYPDMLPPWVRELSPTEAQRKLDERIETIVRTFRGRIDSWDVVNEPLHQVPWRGAANVGIDQSAQVGGIDEIMRLADWVGRCFAAAQRGNPDGYFVLNEYAQYADVRVRENFYLLVRELQARGVPLHAIGIQTHNPPQEWWDPRVVWQTWDLYRRLGLPIQLTEFHPQSSGKPITGGWREGVWDEQAQADFGELMLRLAFGHPSVEVFNWWGLTDRYIWRPGGGLLDKDYRPKEIYRRLDHLVNEEWTTRLQLKTDAAGQARFSGFHGTYEVVVSRDGREPARYAAQLNRTEENRWSFIVP